MSADPAADWVAANHPGEAATFPHPDDGRTRGEVDELLEVPYWETDPNGRPGTRRNPAWRRREALASQTDEIVNRSAGQPCTNCAGPPIVTRGVCRRCYLWARRHGGRMRPAAR